MEITSLTDFQVNQLISMFEELLIDGAYRQKQYNDHYYQKAKQYETKERNLKMALKLYARAALNGQRIQSTIKDFASVLHQCGRTNDAVNFLEKFKILAKGGQKYRNLLENLRKQLTPSGKYFCRKILLTNIPIDINKKQLLAFFNNSSRIQEIIFSSFADCRHQLDQLLYFKFALLVFDTFSAAKKTLETFNYSQWFGLGKYWVNMEGLIICQAQDGRTDFDKITFKYHYDQNWVISQPIIPQVLLQRIYENKIGVNIRMMNHKSIQQANSSAIITIKQLGQILQDIKYD